MDIEQLQELADRLAWATRPDRELSLLVLTELVGIAPGDADAFIGTSDDPARFVDAALALVERRLPGWDVVVKRCSDGSGEAYLIDPNCVYQQSFGHHVATLAILRATVSALVAKHTHDASPDLDEDDQDLGATGPRM